MPWHNRRVLAGALLSALGRRTRGDPGVEHGSTTAFAARLSGLMTRRRPQFEGRDTPPLLDDRAVGGTRPKVER